MSFQAELYRTRGELNAIADEWDSLLQSSPADTIFLTWEWINAWLDIVCPEADLFVVAVWSEEGRLSGVAPFYLGNLRFVKLIDYSCLRVLGDCHSGAEYPDIILLPGHEDESSEAIRQCLDKHSGLWQCAWLPNIAGWTGAMDRLDTIFPQPLSFHRARPSSFSCIELPTSLEEYFASLAKSFRSVLIRQEKKLGKAGELRFEVCESLADVPEFLDALFSLHRKRWESVGQKGSFVRRPLLKKFYKRFAPIALQRGWLGLFALRCNEQIIAVQYGYVYNGAFHQLQEGFAPAEYAGAGNVLRKYVVNWCIAKKLRWYDFLGIHSIHKQHWGAPERFGWQLFSGRKTFKNILIHTGRFWPTGRFFE